MRKRFFAMPILLLTIIMLCSCSSDASDDPLSEIRGRITGVLAGSPADTYISEAGMSASTYLTADEMLSDLLDGRIGCIVTDDTTAKELLSSSRKIRALEDPFSDEEHRFMVAPENPALASDLNDAIAALASDGAFEQLVDEYLSGIGAEPEEQAEETSEPPEEAAPEYSGTLVVAVDPTFYPYCWRDSDGTLQGLDVEAARMVCGKLGLGLTLLEVESDKLLSAIQNGRAAFAVVRTPDIEDAQVVLTDVYLRTSQVVLVHK